MNFSAPPFHPRPWLRNGHLQTIFGNFLPRPDSLPLPTSELVEVASATSDSIAAQVLCLCHWQPVPHPAERFTVILLHGLEGSANSQYVVGNANKMWAAGFHVVRMNMRNCGRTEALSPTLYHSGLSGDVEAVMRALSAQHHLGPIALCGYSMGGNLVLKLAGETGASNLNLAAVVGVSPALDLGPSADALHRPFNRLYERRFLRALIKRYQEKARLFPTLFDPTRTNDLHSLRDFDERVTAFYAGFAGASDYYFRAAAARVLPQIAVPTLILHAQDDPFVHITPESRQAIANNPNITLIEPEHGGHCAFLAKPTRSDKNDGYWAESTLLSFLQQATQSPAQHEVPPARRQGALVTGLR